MAARSVSGVASAHAVNTDLPSTEETIAGDPTLESETLASEPGSEPTAAPPQRGTSIGRYVILGRVGRGGMGVVYAAYDPELDRKVALKVLVPRGTAKAEEAGRRRLLREAQAMARVSHPNVVVVHDVGVHDDRVFVAMEFVDGPTLAQWLREETRTPARILALFVQAGRGLAAAHAKGLVHRDFKPDNVMVGRDDAEDRPRAQVMDFGLVRAEATEDPGESMVGIATSGESLAADQGLTRVGQLMGTPAFMAPEQFAHDEIDARTDQFSFCVALWSALYGQHPFGGENLVSMAGRVLAGELVEPPATAGVDPRLRRVLQRGLALGREDRWPSMDALLAELRRDRSRRRRRVALGLAGVAAVGLLLGGRTLLDAHARQACDDTAAPMDELWSEENQARLRQSMIDSGHEGAADTHQRLVPWVEGYADRWRDARQHACLAFDVDDRWNSTENAVAIDCLERRRELLSSFVLMMFGADIKMVDDAIGIVASMSPPGECVDERFLAHQAPPLLDPDQQREYRTLSPAFSQVNYLVETGRLDEAVEEFEQLRERVEALGHGATVLRLIHLEANLLSAQGRRDDTTARFRDAFAFALELGATQHAGDLALELAGRHLGEHDLEASRWATGLATSLYRRTGEPEDGLRFHRVAHLDAWIDRHAGRLDQARTHALQALAIGELHLGAGHPQLADDLCLLSVIDNVRGAYEDAENYGRRCVAMHEQALGPEHPWVAKGLEALGDVLRIRGRTDEAIEVLQRALRITEKSYPADHTRVGQALGNLGLALNHAGRPEQALPLVERSIAIAEHNGGPGDYDLGVLLVNLGNVRQSLLQHEGSRQAYQRALEIIEADPAPDRMALGVVLSNLANSELMLGRAEEAIAHHRRALEAIEGAYGAEHPQLLAVLDNLGTALLEQKRYGEAVEIYARALALGETVQGPEHVDLAFALLGLADAHLGTENASEALPLAERALALRKGAEASDQDRATAQWGVARALRSTGQDPSRASELATAALETFERLDNPTAHEIRAFLDGP